MTTEDDGPLQDGAAAKIVAGLSFLYALVVTVVLLVLRDFFRDDSNRDIVLLWLLIPVVSSFGTWMAAYSGFPPLRVWVWLGIVLTLFLCWIASFSFGMVYLPVAVLMMVAAVSPWDQRRR